jgi:hypothetical protein
MSKCDIRIEFDRKDRTYAGGETVTGRVHIRLNESVKSKGISLTHQWRTHGRGNVKSGPKETLELESARSYSPGEEHELPFSLTASSHPVTYHGTLINVDHYVSVQMDVPWAFNPKAEEEYLLKPGEPPAGFVGGRNAPITLNQTATTGSVVGKVFLFIILGAVLAAIAVFAIFLLPIILLVAGFFWFRSKALKNRLGEVKLSIPYVVVAPGEQWTARVQFQPQKQFRINSIGLTLLAKEVATSGSGTKSTTHRHTILEQKSAVRSNEMLTPGELVSEDFTFAFPATDAYSLDLSDNKVQWTAEVRIDIPAFPDWAKSQPLQVVPATFLKNVTDAPAPKDFVDDATYASEPVSFSPPKLSIAPEESEYLDDKSVAADENFSSDLLALASSINAAPRHGSERGDMVAAISGQIFDATIVIDRVTSLMGSMSSDPRYEYGKSVTGTIKGTNQSIQVLTPESQNDQIDDLRRGDVWQTEIVIMDFDSLYNRINSRQVDENAS